MRSTLALAACLWVGGAFAAEEKKEAPAVQVTNLMLGKPLPQGEFAGYLFVQPGTTLDLILAVPDKFLLGIDHKASKLTSFTDDKKTDLTKGSFPGSWLQTYFVLVSKNGHRCAFRVQVPGVPVKGAERILVKASIALNYGTGEKTAEGKGIVVKMNAETAVGPYTLKVANVGNQFIGPQLTLLAPERNVKSVEFLDAKGAPIMARGGQPGQLFGQQKFHFGYGYSLPSKAVPASVKVTYFDKVESVEVPLDLKVGVGLD